MNGLTPVEKDKETKITINNKIIRKKILNNFFFLMFSKNLINSSMINLRY